MLHDYAGHQVELNPEGFMTDSSEWTPEVAESMAAELGYFLMLKPLAPGDHEIHFTGGFIRTEEDHGEAGEFTLDITYNLTVEDPPF